jgi:alpha-D-ribose 1-methylphosphonate 5-triphosphate synthase subunit PhnG
MTPSFDRDRRLEALGLADGAALIGLADRVLEDLPVTVTRGPSVGLLMVRVEEPSERRAFNFTEVTVTEAEVAAETAAGGERGYAMVMGRQPERALAAAVLDAALTVGHPVTAEIEALLREALAAEEQRRAAAWQEIAETRVAFEEMAP